MYLAGLPIAVASNLPVTAPKMLRATSRTARPIVALARLPEPSALEPEFIPIPAACGPLTITHEAAPPVLLNAAWALNEGSSTALSAATTIGK